MPRKNIEFNLEIDESINEIFDENSGNSLLALRRLRWNPNSEYKLDLRKWYTTSEGEEIPGKGFSFITDDGPNELVKVLVKHNFGNTEDILEQLSEREDFTPSLNKLIRRKRIQVADYIDEDNASNNQEFYDPKELF